MGRALRDDGLLAVKSNVEAIKRRSHTCLIAMQQDGGLK